MDGIQVYGHLEIPEEIKRREEDARLGIIRYHPTTYLEYMIPSALEKKISNMIERQINKFEKTCQCEDCKEKRNLL